MRQKDSGRRAMKELNKKFTFPLDDHQPSTDPISVKYYDEEYFNPTKLYVSHIAPDTSELSLRAVFMPYGRIEEISLMRTPDGSLKGYAFIKYSRNEEAVEAIRALHHQYKMEGSELNLLVKFSTRNDVDVIGEQRKSQVSKRKRDNRTKPVYYEEAIGNSPPMIPLMHQNILQPSHLPQQIPLQSSPLIQQNISMQQYYSTYMQYYSSLAAQSQQALQSKHPSAEQPQQRTSQRYSFQQSSIPECNLYASNIPSEYSEADLCSLFGSFGTIKNTLILRDKQTGISKGCALISFDRSSDASLAVQQLNGMQIKGKKIAVSIKRQT